jgi:hypothetical protein
MKDSIKLVALVSQNALWIGITIMVQVVNVLVSHVVKTHVLKLWWNNGIAILLLVIVLIAWPVTQKAIVAKKIGQLIIMVYVRQIAKNLIMSILKLTVMIVVYQIVQDQLVIFILGCQLLVFVVVKKTTIWILPTKNAT